MNSTSSNNDDPAGETGSTGSGDLQRLMNGKAIGRRLEVTVWRNGALVDCVAVARELVG